MKRILSVTLGILALAVLLVPAGAFAGEGCGAAKTSGTAAASQVSAKGQCTADQASACAAKLGMTPEECQKLCASGEFTMVNVSVKGMTCTGCESTITASLSQLPGVVKVGKVSWQDGTAFVLVDTKKVQNEAIVKAVTDKGYKAEIIPAVSTTQVGSTTGVDAQHPCGAAAAAGCAKTCTKPCTGTAKTEKTEKTETKSGGGI